MCDSNPQVGLIFNASSCFETVRVVWAGCVARGVQYRSPDNRVPERSATRQLRLQVTRAEAKQILFDQESRYGLQAGINKVADAVGVTLGPRGAFRLFMGSWLFPPPAHNEVGTLLSGTCTIATVSHQRLTRQRAGRNVVLEQQYGVPQVRWP